VSEPPPTARNAAAAANHSAGCRRRRWSRSELPAEQRPPQQRALGAPHTQRPAVLAAGWPAVLAAGWPVSAGRKAIETRSGGSGAAAAARRAQCTRFISVVAIVVFRLSFHQRRVSVSSECRACVFDVIDRPLQSVSVAARGHPPGATSS
jgi:hypothetical protein